jgi:hypothetical protein
MTRRQCLALGLACAATRARTAGSEIEERVAVQGVCAWPNLQRLGDGTLIASIFNQPCHGLWEGDLDCWASEDSGRTWRFRGRAAAHEPGRNRMNCAAGLARNGDLLVLCSGWTDRRPAGQATGFAEARILRPWICRSSDGARTWKVETIFPSPPVTQLGKDNEFVPFGDICQAADGTLCASVYLKRGDGRANYVLRSKDDGHTWGELTPLNPEGNETAILHVGKGRWLAASREFRNPSDVHLELLSSADDGHNWKREGPLTLPRQITGHLTRLNDGRVLLTYGNRNWGNYGVDARLTDDAGKNWGAPFRIAAAPHSDCGYPSTVQLPDGRAVTAFYTKISGDFHYEMRVAIWKPDEFATAGTAKT